MAREGDVAVLSLWRRTGDPGAVRSGASGMTTARGSDGSRETTGKTKPHTVEGTGSVATESHPFGAAHKIASPLEAVT